jgi:hypothetical protein
MANKYYVGQGRIYIASRDSSGQTSGFVEVGDADGLSINTSQNFLDYQESQTGNRNTVIHAVQSTDFAFSMNVQNIDGENLRKAFYGSNTVNSAGSVTDEAVTLYNGEMTPLAYPGVSSVVVKIDAGVTTLVEDTDYTVDAVNGTVTILSGSTDVVAGTPEAATISYSYEANNVVEASVANQLDYIVRFEGINAADDNKPVLVTLHRVALDMSSTLDLIGSDVTSLSIGGKLLPDSGKGVGESAYFKIVQK